MYTEFLHYSFSPHSVHTYIRRKKVHIVDDTKKKTFNFKHWIKYYADVPIETFLFVEKKTKKEQKKGAKSYCRTKGK